MYSSPSTGLQNERNQAMKWAGWHRQMALFTRWNAPLFLVQ